MEIIKQWMVWDSGYQQLVKTIDCEYFITCNLVFGQVWRKIDADKATKLINH